MNGALRAILAVVVLVSVAAIPVRGAVVEFDSGGTIVGWTAAVTIDGPTILALVRPAPPESIEEGETEEKAGEGRDARQPLPPCDGERPEDAPLELWSVPTSGGEPSRLRTGLPPDARAIRAHDLDGDGIDEILMDSAAGRVRLGRDPAGDRALMGGGVLHDLPDGRVAVAGIGRLTVLASDPEGAWDEVGGAAIPVRVSVRRWSALVGSPGVRVVGETANGTTLLAAQAEAVGTRRLRVRLFVVAADGSVEERDCWARLPEPEDLLESWVVTLDGEPHLVATTKEGGKLGLFVEKRIRVFALRADRTRLGDPPAFVAESRMNLWQGAWLTTPDVDGDGREDLAFAYWKGLKDDRVVVDVHVRDEEGGFVRRPRSSAFDVVDADRSWARYGDDLDGDGRPDLLVRTGSELRLHRGLAGTGRGRPVDRKPTALRLPERIDEVDGAVEVVVGGTNEVRIRSNRQVPVVEDVDGDGDVEIVALGLRDERDILIVLEVTSD